MTKPTHNVTTPIKRPGMEKTYWHQVGSAWVDGAQIGISLDSLPLPQMDLERGLQTRLVLYKKDGDARPVQSTELNDEVPF